MNLFTEIQGKKGEDLASAILRFLLLRSLDIREAFVECMSDASPAGPIGSSSHFFCSLEEPTADAGRGSGRVDLLIETDDSVVGVENKLHAHFQEDQPKKYLETLRKKAGALAELRRETDKHTHLVAVLLPESRQSEALERIRGQDIESDAFVLTWQDVLTKLDLVRDKLDTRSSIVFDFFKEFIVENVGFIPQFKKWLPHLQARFEPKGTELQRIFVGHVREFFPDAGSWAQGSEWVGYGFSNFPTQKGREWAWYGFVPADMLEEIPDDRGARFIVSSTFPAEDVDDQYLCCSKFAKKFLRNANKDHVWLVDLDESWSNPERWRKALELFERKAQQMREQSVLNQPDNNSSLHLSV